VGDWIRFRTHKPFFLSFFFPFADLLSRSVKVWAARRWTADAGSKCNGSTPSQTARGFNEQARSALAKIFCMACSLCPAAALVLVLCRVPYLLFFGLAHGIRREPSLVAVAWTYWLGHTGIVLGQCRCVTALDLTRLSTPLLRAP